MVSLFARPIRVFGNVAVLILCIVLFLVPFALRGAKMSVSRMENDIKDWLPSEFPETKDLEWFGKHFIGERFVLLTWPGCNESDPAFRLLVEKLRSETAVNEEQAAAMVENAGDRRRQVEERLRARQLGDDYGLLALADPASYYENWGGQGEKWLRGEGESWFYITPTGEFYRWNGEQTLWGALGRSLERMARGVNTADGELVATIGDPVDNEFHQDPRRLGARFFNSVQTGPEVLADLSSRDGPLWPRINVDVDEEDKPFVARKEALERLTGSLYGPAVPPAFTWEKTAFLELLPETSRSQLPTDWEARFDTFIEESCEGDLSVLTEATPREQSTYWEDLCATVQIEAPPRQTCLIVTLSEPGKQQLARVVGRPILRNPPGKLLDLAMNECQLDLEEIKLGGPPVDNVAIDEEGSITLFNLIGWSAVMGLGLSYLCFRSIRLTMMVFFVGGVSMVASLSVVWWVGASVDAVLMSMPALVYVLGLAGAVHIVNYYQEAVREHGLDGAPERALADGWGPCTLAAFTTALGLLSLYTSNLMPIKKFGLYSAIGVVLTLTLLFTYLPAALYLWPRRSTEKSSQRTDERSGLGKLVEQFWVAIGRFIVRRHGMVATVCLLVMVGVGYGLTKTETSVQLMKLFDPGAKIIRDYGWLETNFGKLVPMELVVRVMPSMVQPSTSELEAGEKSADDQFKLNFLERMELVAQVQSAVEGVFGDEGKEIVGQGLSAATFAPELPPPGPTGIRYPMRQAVKAKLEQSRDEFLASDYLRVEPAEGGGESELWRISLRLGALNDVDYGNFLEPLRLVVEPILSAYRHREVMLRELARRAEGKSIAGSKVAILGIGPPKDEAGQVGGLEEGVAAGIDQAALFNSTMDDVLRNANCKAGWFDPDNELFSEEILRRQLPRVDAVVLVRDDPRMDLDVIREAAAGAVFIDARDHNYEPATSPTAIERGAPIQVVYTGVVPVVYKAQGTLLESLGNSIALAFVMIAVVMMILLRDWGSRPGLFNWVNMPAGAVSMIPNVFPVVLIFGAMGHLNFVVDIGTMMCASVAMGVAVDDTIHFLTWFRHGLREGLNRNDALIGAYRRVATAMTQTTLIGGLGLSVFAFSTFTPTQRFGVMMVTLLAAALIGDLVLLPALLAGPLGRCFCPRSARRRREPTEEASHEPILAETAAPRPHQPFRHLRSDSEHRRGP